MIAFVVQFGSSEARQIGFHRAIERLPVLAQPR
jgi:hypothetical protein